MAKSRAQRKAEQRRRAAQQAQDQRASDVDAQQRTQVPESANVAEAELAERGADLDSLTGQPPEGNGAEAPAAPQAPAPSRADVGRPVTDVDPAPDKISRRARKREEREARERAKESERRRAPREVAPERQRGRVAGFIASCWAELKRVQWPDRETLIQASAVTLVFIAVAAAYLGALDAVFNEVVKLIL